MRPLRYSINVTLDGCCDHREGSPTEETHRHATQTLERADALLFGRVTYEMMESAWRPPGQMDAMPDWMVPPAYRSQLPFEAHCHQGLGRCILF